MDMDSDSDLDIFHDVLDVPRNFANLRNNQGTSTQLSTSDAPHSSKEKRQRVQSDGSYTTPPMSKITKSIIELTASESCYIDKENVKAMRIPGYISNRQLNGKQPPKRETGLMNSTLVPNAEHGTLVDSLNVQSESMFHYAVGGNGRSKIFVVTYMNDGNTIMTASQDQLIRLYDNKYAPPQRSSEGPSDHPVRPNSAGQQRRNGKPTDYVLGRVLAVPDVGWSIIDVAVSGSNSRLVYGTWSSCIYEVNLHAKATDWTSYKLCSDEMRMCVFSLRYSDDDTRILCGCKDLSLRIIDRLTGDVTTTISHAHGDDINAVVFGSERSTFLFSGSDDGLVKVWDARANGSQDSVGTFAGHVDGVTSLDSRGDDRYIISNSKDQTVKLWDIRSFSSEESVSLVANAVGHKMWDYRYALSPVHRTRMAHWASKSRDIGDASAMTFTGEHKVNHTLIRAYFSPAFSTGQRFILTGSADGQAVVYDIVSNGEHTCSYKAHHAPVRDVAWHPHRSEIVSAGWDGVCKIWRYNGQNECVRGVNGDANSSNDNDEDDDSSENDDGDQWSVSFQVKTNLKSGRPKSAGQVGSTESW